MRFPPPPNKYSVISETGGKAASLCRASSSSTKARSSRTKSKISLAVRSAMARLPKLILLSKTGGREARRLGESKEAPKIPCCGRGDFFWRTVSHSRKCTRYFRNVGRLIALAAPRLRREVWRVRLNQNVLERQFFRNVANVLCLRIS